MQLRQLGQRGPSISPLGLGCMGMSEFYGPSDQQENLATLAAALELGINFWDTSDMYGQGHNEQLLSIPLKEHRDEIFIATKFGVQRNTDGEFIGVSGHPDYVRQACDASLQRLGIDHIDLYYQHRVDPTIPIEETIGAMARLVELGKVRYLGLSEASATTLRRASNIHPIHALQTEYSLWSTDVEAEILPTCHELGVSLVAYSPLGRGFLSDRFQHRSELSDNDWRLNNPRFAAGSFEHNLRFKQALDTIAHELDITTAQLALAWLLHQSDHIIPIPGTRKTSRLQENAAAADITLNQSTLNAIQQAQQAFPIEGTRYPEAMMAALNA